MSPEASSPGQAAAAMRRPQRWLRYVVWGALGIVAAIAVLDMVGWMLDIPLLTGINPQWQPMKVITAVCFLLSAAALACVRGFDHAHPALSIVEGRGRSPATWRVRIGQACGAVVGLVGLATAATYLVEAHTGEAAPWAGLPVLDLFLGTATRMAIITALIYSVFGVVLGLVAGGGRRAAGIGHAALTPITLMAYLVIIGYIFQVPAFYEWMNLGVALTTGLAFCALFVAAFCIRPETWVMGVLTGDEAGAVMARRLLPPLMVLPLVIGWLRIQGERAGVFDSALGVALVAAVYIICFFWLVWLTAKPVNRTDRQRRQAEETLRKMKDQLEVRVRERTAELAQAAAALQTASLYARSLIEASLDPLVTISPEGKITDVNKATEEATGVARTLLVGRDFSDYFTEPEKAREGYQKVIAEGLVHDYPLTIRHVSGRTMDVLYNATVYRNEAGQVEGVFAAARNITRRKEAERRQSLISALLELFATKAARKEYLDSAVGLLQAWTGCRCAGIRIANAGGNIPYEAHAGFSPEFVERERNLSLHGDACVCSRVVAGRPEPSDLAAMTAGGSFHTNDSSALAAGLTKDQKRLYRATCMHFGFQSLAVIPIRYHGEGIGAIHLADPAPGKTPTALVEFLESLAPLIGEAVHRFNAEAALKNLNETLEHRVADRTADLARSNKDLEQFAYVASHDLQEPLRMVTGFMELLKQNYGGRLDAAADQYIHYATDGARRMQGLITDLLAYSRAGAAGPTTGPADSGRALQRALANLRVRLDETGAEVTTGDLPAVRAEEPQLMQVFQNLVGNALKFRSDAPPRIHVDARRDGPTWVFSVRDNGIGIDPQFQDRIFMIFQRLHTRSQYPGSGIGLAICKKIIERHGGRIWVESQIGRGATFYFTLPAEANV